MNIRTRIFARKIFFFFKGFLGYFKIIVHIQNYWQDLTFAGDNLSTTTTTKRKKKNSMHIILSLTIFMNTE